jgi:pyrimidine deaminase RibD-like protein
MTMGVVTSEHEYFNDKQWYVTFEPCYIRMRTLRCRGKAHPNKWEAPVLRGGDVIPIADQQE